MKRWVNCELSTSETQAFKVWLWEHFEVKPEVSYVLPDVRHLEIPVPDSCMFQSEFIEACNAFIDTL